MSTGNFGTGAWDDGGWQAAKASQLSMRELRFAGEPIHLTASCEGISVQKEGTVAQPAQKRPLAEDDVVKQLKKTGGSFYGADDISVELDGDSFVPVSALNELRRETLDALTEKLQDRQKRTYVPEYGRKAETAQSEAGESTVTAAAMPPLHYADTQRPQPTQMLCLCPAGRAGICCAAHDGHRSVVPFFGFDGRSENRTADGTRKERESRPSRI